MVVFFFCYFGCCDVFLVSFVLARVDYLVSDSTVTLLPYNLCISMFCDIKGEYKNRMITDNPRHNTENKRTSITLFFSGIFVSVAILFLLIISRLLKVDREELTNEAFTDYITSSRIITPGSIYITSYEGNTAKLISGFTGSKWNHIALVGEDNLVHEISHGEIRSTDMKGWREKWQNRTIVLLERRDDLGFVVNDKVYELKKEGIKVCVNPIFLSGLLMGFDLKKDSMYCTKFVRYIMQEDLPLIPMEYVNPTEDSIIPLYYYKPYSLQYLPDPSFQELSTPGHYHL